MQRCFSQRNIYNCETTRRHIPVDSGLRSHQREQIGAVLNIGLQYRLDSPFVIGARQSERYSACVGSLKRPCPWYYQVKNTDSFVSKIIKCRGRLTLTTASLMKPHSTAVMINIEKKRPSGVGGCYFRLCRCPAIVCQYPATVCLNTASFFDTPTSFPLGIPALRSPAWNLTICALQSIWISHYHGNWKNNFFCNK